MQLSRAFSVSGVWSAGCELEPGLAVYSLQGTGPNLPRALGLAFLMVGSEG